MVVFDNAEGIVCGGKGGGAVLFAPRLGNFGAVVETNVHTELQIPPVMAVAS